MSNNKMLIDATHPEETRVVVLREGRVEEFDYESAARKLLRGNIYLAKVTRVEPSLQAAFVDYGGNRHGFLAFNEIHPDYYQIPMADRQALLDEEARAEAAEEAAADAHAERMARRRQQRQSQSASRSSSGDASDDRGEDLDQIEEAGEDAPPSDDDRDHDDHDHDDHGHDDDDHGDGADDPDHGARRALSDEGHGDDDVIAEDLPEPEVVGGFEPGGLSDADAGDDRDERSAATQPDDDEDVAAAASDAPAPIGLVENESVDVVAAPVGEGDAVEQTGAEDALEELPARPRRRPRSYKIQEVIKRRQVILVQVVKEERGNKGAALTTYLSLAGRYTVLMPNTARGGGISRKITNPQDRKRLKAIAAELEVPEGMGLIIRTAGAARTQQEIKRDYEYLLRLWESVRDLTLQSTAPSLVYEEGNLIKRSIRDLYNKDVEEVVVAGEPAHREAKDFMRMLMPSHAKNVILHSGADPLFNKYGIERQLNAMFSPFVTLKSGGYLVINQTEALVAIDVNSGKSTREFSIEETAYNTNLEASDEIARQLKLRDLAGLIVIDFIDMEEKRNNRSVERRLKDALRFDRARIQLGRISHFGLMEMSRQRLRTGVLEGSTTQCPHCQGTGIIRSTESVALAVLRGIEDALMTGHPASLVATTTAEVALYILNNKRRFITDLEAHHGISITVQASDKLQGANFNVEKTHVRTEAPRRPERSVVNMDWGFEGGDDAEETDGEPQAEGARFVDDVEEREPSGSNGGRDEGGRGRGRKRRRRGRRGERPGRPDGDYAETSGDRAARDFNGGSRDDEDRDTEAPPREGGQFRDDIADDDMEADGDTGGPGQQDAADGRNGAPRGDDKGGRRRRRGRRGGRRGRGRDRGDAALAGDAGQDGTTGDNGYPTRTHVTEEFVDDFAGSVEEAPQTPAEPAGTSVDVKSAGRSGPRDGGRHRRSGSRRAPSEDTAATETPDSNVEVEANARPIAAAQSEPVTELAAEANPEPRRRYGEPVSTEPRLERVVVTPDHAAAEQAAAEQPARRGWWQRKLGGE